MIHRGDGSTFVLASNVKSYLLFKILCELYFNYWDNQEYAVDYLFFDFFIRIIADLNNEIASQIFTIAEDRGFYNLNLNIINKYEEDWLTELLRDSPLQKLTYKNELTKHIGNGLLTNYGWILERDKI